MRITGGAARGKKIAPARGGTIRPTSAKVREALFDVLRGRVPSGTFLDLCAGTGAVGLEALSRGYARVVFVDADREAVRLLRTNVARLGLAEGRADSPVLIRCSSARDYIDRARRGGPDERFDVVFIDLPYASTEAGPLLERLAAARLVRPGGCVVLEHAARTPPPEGAAALTRLRSYRYGDTALTLYVQE